MIAFSLLGIGTLLVLLGIIFNFVDSQNEKVFKLKEKIPAQEAPNSANTSTINYFHPSRQPDDFLRDAYSTNYVSSQKIPVNSAYHRNASYPPGYREPLQVPAQVRIEELPQQAKRMYNDDSSSTNISKSTLNVVVSQENPKLFQKQAFLYWDKSRSNVYKGENAKFSMGEVSGIRRVGEGTFSYDGFAFYFEKEGDEQKFLIGDLHHVAFYPNCIVLVPQEDSFPALLFTTETKSIRKALETFRIKNG